MRHLFNRLSIPNIDPSQILNGSITDLVYKHEINEEECVLKMRQDDLPNDNILEQLRNEQKIYNYLNLYVLLYSFCIAVLKRQYLKIGK